VSYVAGIQPKILVWSPRAAPKRRGKPLNNTGRRDEPDLISAKHLACDLPNHAWRTIRWREGSADWLSSRFARVRVRVGHSQLMPELLSQEWLLIEWPEGEAAPTKYWLSTLPANISFRELVDFAKLRWLIERYYQEFKQEVGLGHYEGRGWRGFHYHGTMCIAAYGFLISERETRPPRRNTGARSFRQLRRFHHVSNSDKVFGTHRRSPELPAGSLALIRTYPRRSGGAPALRPR
jgi:SRSO17 transposase